jgi:hypothetical protein
MLECLNRALAAPIAEKSLEGAFDLWWPSFEAVLQGMPAEVPAQELKRTEADKLNEILELVRGLSRRAESDLREAVSSVESKKRLRTYLRLAEQQAHAESLERFYGEGTTTAGEIMSRLLDADVKPAPGPDPPPVRPKGRP